MAETNKVPVRDAHRASSSRWAPQSEADCRATRQQLAAILVGPQFKTSKRCRALLTHVVEKKLCGDADDLKERSLGIEVFHRNPQYDTNADPVVRQMAERLKAGSKAK